MLLAHGPFGICPLEVAALLGAGSLWLLALRLQLGTWLRKFFV